MRRAILPWTLVVTACAALYGCDGDDDDDPMDPDPTGIELQSVANGLTSPIALADPDDGTGRLLIADQAGLIRVVDATGALRPTPFLDLRSRMVALMPEYDERGLLGLALAPDYATSGRFFVYYTAPPRGEEFDNTSVISEFRVSATNANQADPASEVVLLEVDQPQFNHEGGTLAFGPDGMLYISIGDGGGAGDIGFAEAAEWEGGDLQGHVPDWYEANAGGNGQDITENLLGSVLRVDVSAAGTYTVPSDNPFVGRDGLDEIYAYGFRNPYRFSFDRATGDLLVGDAGQNLWEEVSVVESGGNYGWNVKEGTHCFDASDFLSVPASCPSTDPETGEPLIDPVIELLNHHNPAAVTGAGILTVIGGHVYRGDAIPDLRGSYVFGSFTSADFDQGPAGQIFVAEPSASGLWPVDVLELEDAGEDIDRFILSFGEDSEGEVYVLTTRNTGPSGSTGEVLKLVPAGSDGGENSGDNDDDGDTGGGGDDPGY